MRWVLEYEPNCEWLLVHSSGKLLGYVLANGYRGDNNVRMFSALRVSDGRRDSFPDYVQLTGTILECALALEKAVTQ